MRPPDRFLKRLSHIPRRRGSRSFTIFFFNDTATTEIYTLSLHDALPICGNSSMRVTPAVHRSAAQHAQSTRHLRYTRSEEHTSELQSQSNLVCRLLLEKKKKNLAFEFAVSLEVTPTMLADDEYMPNRRCS